MTAPARKLYPVAQQYAHRALTISIPRRSQEMRDAFVAQYGEVAKWSKEVVAAWTQMAGGMILDEMVIAFCAGFETAVASSSVVRDGTREGPTFIVDVKRVEALGKEVAALIEFAMPENVS